MLMTDDGSGHFGHLRQGAADDDAPTAAEHLRERLRRFVGAEGDGAGATWAVMIAARAVIALWGAVWFGAVRVGRYALFLEESQSLFSAEETGQGYQIGGIPYSGMVHLNEARAVAVLSEPAPELHGVGTLPIMRSAVLDVLESVREIGGNAGAQVVTITAEKVLKVEVRAEDLRRVLAAAAELLAERGVSARDERVAVWVTEAWRAPTCVLMGSCWVGLLEASDPTQSWYSIELDVVDARAPERAS